MIYMYHIVCVCAGRVVESDGEGKRNFTVKGNGTLLTSSWWCLIDRWS